MKKVIETASKTSLIDFFRLRLHRLKIAYMIKIWVKIPRYVIFTPIIASGKFVDAAIR